MVGEGPRVHREPRLLVPPGLEGANAHPVGNAHLGQRIRRRTPQLEQRTDPPSATAKPDRPPRNASRACSDSGPTPSARSAASTSASASATSASPSVPRARSSPTPPPYAPRPRGRSSGGPDRFVTKTSPRRRDPYAGRTYRPQNDSTTHHPGLRRGGADGHGTGRATRRRPPRADRVRAAPRAQRLPRQPGAALRELGQGRRRGPTSSSCGTATPSPSPRAT